MVPATVSHGKKPLVSLQFILEEPLACFLVYAPCCVAITLSIPSFLQDASPFLGLGDCLTTVFISYSTTCPL
jgi:hypothetical protein